MKFGPDWDWGSGGDSLDGGGGIKEEGGGEEETEEKREKGRAAI